MAAEFKASSQDQQWRILDTYRATFNEPLFFELFRNEKTLPFIIEYLRQNPKIIQMRNRSDSDVLKDLMKKNYPKETILEVLPFISEIQINIRDKMGKTSLEYALQYEDKELILKFLEHGANINDHIPMKIDEDRHFKETLESKQIKDTGKAKIEFEYPLFFWSFRRNMIRVCSGQNSKF